MSNRAKTSAIFLMAAMLLSGCGVRGALDKPSASGAGPTPTSTADADSGQGKKVGDTPKPHKPFILDGILE